jgi:hypothetical protein
MIKPHLLTEWLAMFSFDITPLSEVANLKFTPPSYIVDGSNKT